MCSKIPEYEERHIKQQDIQNTLEARITDLTKEFFSLRDKVTQEEKVELKLQREVLRPITISEAKKQLQAVYKDKFNFNQFSEAKSYISDSIDEVEHEHTIKQRLEYAREQRQHYNSKTQVLKGNTEQSR